MPKTLELLTMIIYITIKEAAINKSIVSRKKDKKLKDLFDIYLDRYAQCILFTLIHFLIFTSRVKSIIWYIEEDMKTFAVKETNSIFFIVRFAL